MSSLRRSFWLGVLLAPLGGPIALQLYVFLLLLVSAGPAGLKDWPAVLALYGFFGLPIAYGAMFLFGLPYLLWLRKTQRFSWLMVCAGGAFAGSASLVAGLFVIGRSVRELFSVALIGGMLGLVCGVLFCLITGVRCSMRQSREPATAPGQVA